MRGQCRMRPCTAKKSSTGRSGCVGGAKGAGRPSTDAGPGASNILCCFYGARINKNLRETIRKRERESEKANKKRAYMENPNRSAAFFDWNS